MALTREKTTMRRSVFNGSIFKEILNEKVSLKTGKGKIIFICMILHFNPIYIVIKRYSG